jgi:hypothetical protein
VTRQLKPQMVDEVSSPNGHVSGPRGVNGKGPSGKVFGDYTFEKAIGVKTNV